MSSEGQLVQVRPPDAVARSDLVIECVVDIPFTVKVLAGILPAAAACVLVCPGGGSA